MNEKGEIIPKDRPTHDLSFPGCLSGTSINSSVDEGGLLPTNYGHMHRRCLHHIVHCRRMVPTKQILVRKDDWSSAYKRMHVNVTASVQSLTKIEKETKELLLFPLQLTFGGKPGPSEWGAIAEPITDLANELLNCEVVWDPFTLFSPLQSEIPEPKLLPDEVEIKQARSLIIDLPEERNRKADLYIIDDGVTIGIHDDVNRARLTSAMLLAIHIATRELAEHEHILRDKMQAIEKLIAEAEAGALAEILIILGWLYNMLMTSVDSVGINDSSSHESRTMATSVISTSSSRKVQFKDINT